MNKELNKNPCHPKFDVGQWRYLLKSYINDDEKSGNNYNLCSNLDYSLEYLEFLNNQIKNRTGRHFTIQTLNIKIFVITGMGVIEGLLYFMVKSLKESQVLKYWKTIDNNGIKEHIVTIKKREMTEWSFKKIKLVNLISTEIDNNLIQSTKNNNIYMII